MATALGDRQHRVFAVHGKPPRQTPRRATCRLLTTGLIAGGDLVAFTLAAVIADVSPVVVVAYGATLAVVMIASHAYRSRLNLVAIREIPALATAAGVSLLALAVVGLLVPAALDAHRGVSRAAIAMAALVVLLLPIGRSVTYAVVRALRGRRVALEPVVVVGAGDIGRQLAHVLDEHAEHGLQPVGFVDDIGPAAAPVPLLGDLNALDRVLTEHSVRRVVVAFGAARECDLLRVLRTSLRRSVEVYVVPRLHHLSIDGAEGHTDCVACIPLQRLRPAAVKRPLWRAKRLVDVVLAGTALIVLAPLLVFLAIGVTLSSPGPVLFRQRRVGQDNRMFELLKFRSLRMNDDSDVRWSVADDRRQTRLGRWMRRFSLDELPQLWNVVRGDMSLVGPRPERPHFVEQFSDDVAGYADRHRLPVGVTGWAQVNGLRGDTSIAERATYDNHYIDDWSLRRDMSILVATATAVLRDGKKKPHARTGPVMAPRRRGGAG